MKTLESIKSTAQPHLDEGMRMAQEIGEKSVKVKSAIRLWVVIAGIIYTLQLIF